jgi:Zn-dependent M28 family amino/carboxypeptidase
MDVEEAFDRLPVGLTNAHASLNIPEPVVTTILLRNVVGILRGSDSRLQGQYVLISAHYDHLGKNEDGGIFNGANDDASGVATVIELAGVLARENPHPARTLVFACFFGEEKGLFGSEWYVKHPLVPLSQTIADINFEQMGEPANNEGLPASSLGVTGFEYSDIPRILEPDLKAAGVTLREVRHNAEFFERSDNLPFAEAGIPAHTFVAALEFPDYHRTTDKWTKLNYTNMAKLDHALAIALADFANRADSPRWNADSEQTREFLTAWRKLHP